MASHTTFIQMSDTHIVAPGETVHGADTAANFRAVVAFVRGMNLDPAFFLITGDLCNEGDAESYTHLRRLVDEMDEFGVPVLAGLGNHDLRLPFRHEVLGETSADNEEERHYYSREIAGLRVLMLDSKVTGRIDGLLGDEQLTWLESQLQCPATAGDIIAVHHPCLPRGVPRPDDFLLQDTAALGEILRHHSVLGVLAGHSHVSSFGVFAGTVHTTAPATAFLLDPSIRDGGRAVAGSGFNLCTVRDGRLLVNAVILPGAQRELFRYGEAAAVALNSNA